MVGSLLMLISSIFPSLLWLSESRNDVETENIGQESGDEVRAPLPVIREALYDDAMLYGYILSSLFLHLF